jgi:hypothetical protein
MKKTMIFCLAFLAVSFGYSQIKVFSGGKVSIGSTTDPGSVWVSHLINGSTTAFTNGTTLTTCAMIKGSTEYSNSTPSAPDYTFWGDQNTGMYHPASEKLAFSTNGNERYKIDNTNHIFTGSYASFAGSTSFTTCALIKGNTNYSAPSGPDYTFYGDQNTGMYHSGSDVLGLATAGSERIKIDNYGRVEFKNTWEGSYGLCLQSYANVGTSKMYSVVYNGSASFYVLGIGNVYAAQYYLGSDLSFKENVQDIEGALDKVKLLRGVTFQRKADVLADNADSLTVISTEPKPVEIGVIAQEVEEIVPELVTTNPDGLKYVAYQNFVGLLIEAIKEQQEQIETLEQRMSDCCNSQYDDKTKSGQTGNDNPEQESKTGSSYLKQNRPNPFSQETIIDYFLDANATNAEIMVFDMTGKLLNTYPTKPGNQSLTITSNDFTPECITILWW